MPTKTPGRLKSIEALNTQHWSCYLCLGQRWGGRFYKALWVHNIECFKFFVIHISPPPPPVLHGELVYGERFFLVGFFFPLIAMH